MAYSWPALTSRPFASSESLVPAGSMNSSQSISPACGLCSQSGRSLDQSSVVVILDGEIVSVSANPVEGDKRPGQLNARRRFTRGYCSTLTRRLITSCSSAPMSGDKFSSSIMSSASFSSARARFKSGSPCARARSVSADALFILGNPEQCRPASAGVTKCQLSARMPRSLAPRPKCFRKIHI